MSGVPDEAPFRIPLLLEPLPPDSGEDAEVLEDALLCEWTAALMAAPTAAAASMSATTAVAAIARRTRTRTRACGRDAPDGGSELEGPSPSFQLGPSACGPPAPALGAPPCAGDLPTSLAGDSNAGPGRGAEGRGGQPWPAGSHVAGPGVGGSHPDACGVGEPGCHPDWPAARPIRGGTLIPSASRDSDRAGDTSASGELTGQVFGAVAPGTPKNAASRLVAGIMLAGTGSDALTRGSVGG